MELFITDNIHIENIIEKIKYNDIKTLYLNGSNYDRYYNNLIMRFPQLKIIKLTI
jgi:hypothetical protein